MTDEQPNTNLQDNVCLEFQQDHRIEAGDVLLHDGQRQPVLAANDQHYYVGFVVEDGMKVVHQRWKTELKEIADDFIKYWDGIWNRERHMPPAHWSALLQAAVGELRPTQLKWDKITVQSYRKTLSKMKKHGMRGMDGVGVEDLLMLPDAWLQHIVDAINDAEATGEWPQQTLETYVICAPKSEEAATAAETRPLTILVVIYRAYAIQRAMEMKNQI